MIMFRLKKMQKPIMVGAVVLLSSCMLYASVITYPAPSGITLSTDYKIWVNGTGLSIYQIIAGSIQGSTRSNTYAMAYFDFSDTVTIKVLPKIRTTIKILPESYRIVSRTVNDTLIFGLKKNCNMSIESGLFAPLLLFANPLEVNVPHQGDANVLYYGPGVTNGSISVGSNQTLYIAGGAVIKGGITASGNNITIRGRGIVDGLTSGGNIRMSGSYIRLEGIIFKSSSGWTVVPRAVDSLTIDNIKVCGNRGVMGDDAMDLVNCKRVIVRNCFLRSWDDAIAIKGMNNPTIPDSAILIEKCVLWTDGANVFRIGCESTAKAMQDITARDIDVIHMESRLVNTVNYFITLQPAENMPIQNLRFENIRVNFEKQSYFIEARPQVTEWSKPPEGNIKNVVFKDIIATGPFTQGSESVRIVGASSVHNVDNLQFDNVVINGQCLQSNLSYVNIGSYTSNINFNCSQTGVLLPQSSKTIQPICKMSRTNEGTHLVFPTGGTYRISVIQLNGKSIAADKIVNGDGVVLLDNRFCSGVFIMSIKSQDKTFTMPMMLVGR